MPLFIVIRTIALLIQFLLFFVGTFWMDCGYSDERIRLIAFLSIGFLALVTIWNKSIALAFAASIMDSQFIQDLLMWTPSSFKDLALGRYFLILMIYFVSIVVFAGVSVCVLSKTYKLRWILGAQVMAWFSVMLTVACSHAKFPWLSTSWDFHPWMIGAVATVALNMWLFMVVRKRKWDDPIPTGGGYTAPSVPADEAEIPYGSSLGH